jgi:Ca2+-binding EF-hand superfamily protein
VYEQADTDENGLVSTQEMFDLLNSVEGLPSINMDDVRALMAEIAGAGEDSSVVTFEQFIPVAFTVLKRVITTALAHDKSEEEEEEGEDVNELAGEYLLNSMTPEELELKLREIYNETDVDGNGLISADEMLRLLTSVDGLPDINIENVYVLMSQIAGPGNDASLVTFNQFAPIAFDVLKQLFINQMMKEEGQAIGSDNDSVELSAETLETSILELFQETDLDENGLIDAEELHELLRDIPGVNADIEKCKNFVQHLDDNGDGRLNIKEFAPIAYELLLAATEADAVAMVHA